MKYTSRERSSDEMTSIYDCFIVIIKRFIVKACVWLESRITSIFPFLLFWFNFGEGSRSLFSILFILCLGKTEFCCFKLCLVTDVLSHFKMISIQYESLLLSCYIQLGSDPLRHLFPRHLIRVPQYWMCPTPGKETERQMMPGK